MSSTIKSIFSIAVWSPTTSVVAALAVLLLGTLIYRIFFHPLANIPGPLLAKVSDHWRNRRYWRGTWHDDIIQVHERYGRVVRIAPNEVSVVDQDSVKLLYGHGRNVAKTDWYATWDPPIGAPAFFSARDRKLHSFLRKRVSAAFSMTSILKYEEPIQGLLDLLFQKLRGHAEAGHLVDMAQWAGAFAFDVVGVLGYGSPLGELETETDVMGLRSNVLELFFWSTCMGHYWGQMTLLRNWLVVRILQLFGKKDKMGDFQNWSVTKIQDRLREREKGEDATHSDMLDHFINMKNANGGPATFVEVLAESLNLVGAGADTTSIAISSCLVAVCPRADVYEKLQTEVDKFYAANHLTVPITYLQTQQLPYLCAVIKEAMRLRPSIVAQLLRHTPSEGLTIDGKYIPPNTPIGVSPLAQNRDKAIWGDDANEFRPERWLEDDAKARYLESYNMTFGGNGPRMCIGRNIALVEVHKFLAQIIRHFDTEIVHKDNPYKVKTWWFCYPSDFKMKLTPRYHEKIAI